MSNKLSSSLYLMSGILIALGGLGHSFGAVDQIHAAFASVPLDPRVARLIVAVWHFAGAAMGVLGLLVACDWWSLRQGKAGPAVLPVILGGFYVLYGAAALAWMREPFWAIFVVYGLLAGASGMAARRLPQA